jgi:hypothetical protein
MVFRLYNRIFAGCQLEVAAIQIRRKQLRSLEADEAANHRRYHESIDNLTPADVYFGRGQTILLQRERIKRQTITQRRLQHQRQAA